MKVFLVFVMISLSITISGCGKEEEWFGITGIITRINESSITVFEDISNSSFTNDNPKAFEIILKKAIISDEETNGTIDPKDLKLGQKVDVWFLGVVAEKYPGVVKGSKILVNKDESIAGTKFKKSDLIAESLNFVKNKSNSYYYKSLQFDNENNYIEVVIGDYIDQDKVFKLMINKDTGGIIE